MNGRSSETGQLMKVSLYRGGVTDGFTDRGSTDLSKDAAWLREISKASRGNSESGSPRSSNGGEAHNLREIRGRSGDHATFPRTRSEPQSPPTSSSPLLPSAPSLDQSPSRRSLSRNSSLVGEDGLQHLSSLRRENPDADRSENFNYRPAGEPVAMASLSYLQVHLLGFVVVFTASGLVRMEDLAFVAFASAYSAALGYFMFPVIRRGVQPPSQADHSSLFQVYQYFGATIGLFLPLMYVLGAFSRSDQLASSGATPHLFLLASQILSENVLASWPWVSLPARVVLAIMYNVRRLFTLGAWLGLAKDALATTALGPSANASWSVFGRLLAQLNFVYWSFHLFFYLVPFCLPAAFTSYSRTEETLRGHEGSDNGSVKRFPLAALRQTRLAK